MIYFTTYLRFRYRLMVCVICMPPLYAEQAWCGVEVAWCNAKAAWCNFRLLFLKRRLAKLISGMTPEERARFFEQ